MKVVIRLAQDEPSIGGVEGDYLAAFDADYHPEPAPPGLSGLAMWTDDKAEAIIFEDAGEALDCYRRQSTSVPLRLDGKPNRPLMAYTIAIEPFEATGYTIQPEPERGQR